MFYTMKSNTKYNDTFARPSLNSRQKGLDRCR